MNTNNNQVFKAFLKVTVNGAVMELPIYPRSTKTSVFKNVESAVKRLETVSKKFNQNMQGFVYEYENGSRSRIAYVIAL